MVGWNESALALELAQCIDHNMGRLVTRQNRKCF